MKVFHLFFLLSLLSLQACYSTVDQQSKEKEDKAGKFILKPVTYDIQKPIAMVPLPAGGFLVCGQEGQIWLLKEGNVNKTPVLDISSKMVKVRQGYDERGLLGIALHPQFEQNKKFYVYYSAPSSASGMDNKTVLAEYKMQDESFTKASLDGERKLLEVEQPEFNHEGGDIQFGPDGYLYIGLGDGGGGGDQHGKYGNGQNLNELKGKILRIDVNGNPYEIPSDNPFVGQKEVRPEIWAYGLRNPWRFSFDAKTGELFCGDVGQNKYEEVDIIEKGGNYGWRVMEGYHVFNMPKEGADTAAMIKPIDEYDHSIGISIIGGYVYRGKEIPELEGKYIFGDYNGKTFSLEKKGDGSWERSPLDFTNKPKRFMLYSFAQDNENELYVLGVDSDKSVGAIYKVSQ